MFLLVQDPFSMCEFLSAHMVSVLCSRGQTVGGTFRKKLRTTLNNLNSETRCIWTCQITIHLLLRTAMISGNTHHRTAEPKKRTGCGSMIHSMQSRWVGMAGRMKDQAWREAMDQPDTPGCNIARRHGYIQNEVSSRSFLDMVTSSISLLIHLQWNHIWNALNRECSNRVLDKN